MRRSSILALALLLSGCGAGEEPVETMTRETPVTSSDGPALPTRSEADTLTARGVEEVEMAVMGPTGQLGGALARSLAPRTSITAIIIPGSGPTDRDGNNPLGVDSDAYLLLARGLAEAGVSTLRIDKRGMFSSGGAGDPNAVTLDAYREDVAAWVSDLDTCIVLIGHSEGGMVALHSAGLEGVCGVVHLSAPGRRVGDSLRAQLRSNPANLPILEQADAAISKLEAGGAVDSSELHPGLRPLFDESVQGFVRTLMEFDSVRVASDLDVPLMVIGGSADFQVVREDFDAVAPFADTTLWIENMSHVLKTTKGEGRAASAATYADPELPLADGLVESVAAFILDLDTD